MTQKRNYKSACAGLKNNMALATYPITGTDRSILLVTNGSEERIATAFKNIYHQTEEELSKIVNVTRIDTFRELMEQLMTSGHESHKPTPFEREVLFMFFDDIEFVEEFVCDIMEFCLFHVGKMSTEASNPMCNAHLYFDATLARQVCDDYTRHGSDNSNQFSSIVSLAHNLIQKLAFMLHRIRVVYFDDENLRGSRSIPLHGLLRNFPNIEHVELWSNQNSDTKVLFA